MMNADSRRAIRAFDGRRVVGQYKPSASLVHAFWHEFLLDNDRRKFNISYFLNSGKRYQVFTGG
ncbi:hypothetical protein DESC_780102 [Desulfosarcina cetonica]|nr:hypothetical protein DESC_780102 [Desulfosarcina cetonica]